MMLLPLVSGLLLAGGMSGCGPSQVKVAPPGLPPIPVAHPAQRAVTDFVEYSGRTAAVQTVDIKARVTGYLVNIPFQEGAVVRGDDRLSGCIRLVGLATTPLAPVQLLTATALPPQALQEGDVLFEIDPRPYQAQLDQAVAQIALYQTQLNLAQANYARAKELAKTPGAISPKDVETYLAQQEQSRAALQAAKASLEVYRLNLSFTKVRSPIGGQIGRYNLTIGNLVNQDQTLLATVVSQDPMYVYFDMDEPTLQDINRKITEGIIELPQPGADIPVYMGLQRDPGYPHQGTINFVNNQVNPATGSILVRGVFANAPLHGGIRLLKPGMFVRIRLPIGQPHPALLVLDRAISSDQGQKYVYVVDASNVVQYRRVTTGPLQPDGLRVILPGTKPDEGLKPKDWVVVGGLLQIRQKMKIQPDQLDRMPTLEGQSPAAVTGRPLPPPVPRPKQKAGR
jgi:multidrug efflux system membrane fusion protein